MHVPPDSTPRQGRGPAGSLWALALVSAACSGPPDTHAPFVEVAAASGLDFVHRNAAAGEFHFPELMHSGCAFLDYDDDSFLDAYLVQADGGNRLYRNRGDGTFEDVTERAAVGDAGHGTGVAVADYDRDGHVDLYVTNLGRNSLYRNRGNGTFEDVTRHAGVGDDGYSSAALFVDYDGDGDLDLYVANYVAWSPSIERPCFAPNGLRDYCSPGTYERPQPDTLYRNNGDGTFDDVSRVSGIRAAAGQGLGVVGADFNADGRIDLYVANDQMPNFLWINRGDGTFADEALVRGCALNESGKPEASMGLAVEDVDDDGDWDLFMVHLDRETHTFYRNQEGFFQDVTDRVGLGAASQAFTGFGTGLFDYDCDGWLDVFVANGRVRLGDTMQAGRYAEPNQLLRGGPAGIFEDVSARAGAALSLVEVSRGAAFGDYDNDGDVDILLSNNAGPVRLLRNEARGERHWLAVRLVGRSIDRDGIGSVVSVETGGRTRRRLVQPAYSYGSSNDPRPHFGLGTRTRVDAVSVTWPDGRTERRTDVEADQLLTFVEPRRGTGGRPR